MALPCINFSLLDSILALRLQLTAICSTSSDVYYFRVCFTCSCYYFNQPSRKLLMGLFMPLLCGIVCILRWAPHTLLQFSSHIGIPHSHFLAIQHFEVSDSYTAVLHVIITLWSFFIFWPWFGLYTDFIPD